MKLKKEKKKKEREKKRKERNEKRKRKNKEHFEETVNGISHEHGRN